MTVIIERTIEPMPRTPCTQPACLLRQKGLDPEFFAKVLVRALAGECLDDVVPEFCMIQARPQCTLCALRVMQGGRAYRTADEWRQLDGLGRWHHRRHRRVH